MKRFLAAVLLCSLAGVALAADPATQRAVPQTLEVRANTAFTNGQYAMALSMLKKLQIQYEGQADKLGPIAEKIKVCEPQIQQASAVNGTAAGAAATPPQSISTERK